MTQADTFKANGRTKTFNLRRLPKFGTAVSVHCYFRNERREYPFTVLGKLVTFNGCPPKGTLITVYYGV